MRIGVGDGYERVGRLRRASDDGMLRAGAGELLCCHACDVANHVLRKREIEVLLNIAERCVGDEVSDCVS